MSKTQGLKVTRRDVAELAGVSTAVVSYVVNDGPRPVAPGTRKRVLDAIKTLDYVPSASARALKLGTTGTYGLLVPNVTNTFHAEIVEHIDVQMGAHGWSMLLGQSHNDADRERRVFAEMINRGVDGILLMMSAIGDVEWARMKIPVPTVYLDRQAPVFGHVTIGPDYEDAGIQATQHLIEHGCRRIVPVHGPIYPHVELLRLTGYARAMRDAGLRKSESITTDWSMQGGYEAGLQILHQDDLPDGIFCFSDMLAVGVMGALQDHGVKVPDDVAIVCFDGTSAAQFARPTLTSVTQPIPAMCEAAVSALAEESPDGFDHRMFPVELVRRRSCGC